MINVDMEKILGDTTDEEAEEVMDKILETVSGEDLEEVEEKFGDFEVPYTNWCMEHGEAFMEKWMNEHGEVHDFESYMTMCRDAVNLFIEYALER